MSRRPVNVAEYEALARAAMAPAAFDYYAGGAGDEWTLLENERAFERLRLVPRVLVDVSRVSVATTLLGAPVAMPVLVAPTALHRLAHPDGEAASARAAAACGAVYVASTIASMPLEAIAQAAPGAPRWYQLYVHRDRGVTADLVRRAEAAGFAAIVLTADTPLLGRRERDLRNGFALPDDVTLANLEVSEGGAAGPARAGFATEADRRLDPSLTWADVDELASRTTLPLVVKGVLDPDDARRALDHGARAIIVSNHGGRQLDGAIASVDALPRVVEAVAGRAPVLVDGGIRRGADVLKALALGASAALVGRPALWGLAAAGEPGVRHVLELLRDELEHAMALAGRPTLADVDRSLLG